MFHDKTCAGEFRRDEDGAIYASGADHCFFFGQHLACAPTLPELVVSLAYTALPRKRPRDQTRPDTPPIGAQLRGTSTADKKRSCSPFRQYYYHTAVVVQQPVSGTHQAATTRPAHLT